MKPVFEAFKRAVALNHAPNAFGWQKKELENFMAEYAGMPTPWGEAALGSSSSSRQNPDLHADLGPIIEAGARYLVRRRAMGFKDYGTNYSDLRDTIREGRNLKVDHHPTDTRTADKWLKRLILAGVVHFHRYPRDSELRAGMSQKWDAKYSWNPEFVDPLIEGILAVERDAGAGGEGDDGGGDGGEGDG